MSFSPADFLSANAYLEPMPGSEAFDRDRFTPVFAIHETPDAYEIEGELPHCSAKHIDVKPHRKYVDIACDHAEEHADRPRELGSFSTRLALTHAIDVSRTTVRYHHGVLSVRAPKT